MKHDAMRTDDFPPGYVALIERFRQLIQDWCGAEPGLPDLRWHDPGTVRYVGPLRGEAVRYLADSPDAFRLVEWLDVETGRQGTLAQLTMALQLLGHLPGGPERETVHTSEAFKAIERFADQSGTTTLIAPSPCGHCGRQNELVTGQSGDAPGPGAFSLCALCGGINQFDDGLRLRRVDEAQLEALPPEHRSQLLEMQALLRAARMGMRAGREEVQA